MAKEGRKAGGAIFPIDRIFKVEFEGIILILCKRRSKYFDTSNVKQTFYGGRY